MHHRVAHPQDVPGCFGCKTLGIGFDGDHTTKQHTDQHDTGSVVVTEHRDGRADVLVRPDTTHFKKGVDF